MTTAQELRNAVDPEAVQALVAAFPTPETVGCRQHYDRKWILEKLPQGLDERLLKLEARPDEKATRLIAEPWRPHRGAVAIFTWHCYDNPAL